jgi:3-oxoisoapionate decarboxylase
MAGWREDAMLKIGLNPYGLTFVLGLQGAGTPRANPAGTGLDGFIDIAREIGARVIELHGPWLTGMERSAIATLRSRLERLGLAVVVGSGYPYAQLRDTIAAAAAMGAPLVRVALTPVLCGDRNARADWADLVAGVRAMLREHVPLATAAGLTLAIENHQDFTSAELVAFCEQYGAGICFDTGNAFPVGEAPLDFARRIAPHVRHVHLKDYRVQFTDEGFRLVRCAIGDGAVPVAEIAALLAADRELTASLEPGALEARHVRLLRPEWWHGYAPTTAPALAACLAAARRNRLSDDADWRTPWERGDDAALIGYELDMIRRSAANMRALGLMEDA